MRSKMGEIEKYGFRMNRKLQSCAVAGSGRGVHHGEWRDLRGEPAGAVRDCAGQEVQRQLQQVMQPKQVRLYKDSFRSYSIISPFVVERRSATVWWTRSTSRPAPAPPRGSAPPSDTPCATSWRWATLITRVTCLLLACHWPGWVLVWICWANLSLTPWHFRCKCTYWLSPGPRVPHCRRTNEDAL